MKVRVDKWLWSVRIFKSRSIATKACKAGKVKMNGKVLKASYEIVEGDILQVHKEGFYFEFRVVKLIGKRVSATLARPCYINMTPEEELHKYDSWFVGKSGVEKRERGTGRPTKRERREIDDFKGFESDLFDIEMDWDEV
jgi:ribosome-associated heat shock protein Hsp15